MTSANLALAASLLALTLAGCSGEGPSPGGQRATASPPGAETGGPAPSAAEPRFAGSRSCRDCHQKFYQLWSNSRHSLAMQSYTAAFAKANLTPQAAGLTIGKCQYRAEIAPEAGWVRETGPQGERKYRIAYGLGGKNVYYFLTPLERGRLQVLPLAYDLSKKSWYDTAASAVRHFPDLPDKALPWTDRAFAFNTACFNCHVTQLRTNYDPATDAYHTAWSEPGIGCESCHGSGRRHVQSMEAAEKAGTLNDVRDPQIIQPQRFTAGQTNDLCAVCHAKLVPLSSTFRPGDRFFDHFDLVTLEHPDYYPDGRDLGENYTFTSWRMSPCVKSGKLDCLHCHTSSGRLTLAEGKIDQACLPCHDREVRQPAEHSHHLAQGGGSRCVACHMPATRFAAMKRTDHSMRSPAPAATLAFQSPNACNLCHADHDAAWAEAWVRKWYPRDYQAPLLRQAELVDAARKQTWQRLPEVLAEITREDRDEVVAASLARLLGRCEDPRKTPALIAALRDASPLVRVGAVEGLSPPASPEAVAALAAACADPCPLVRVRAAAALADVPPRDIPPARRPIVRRAEDEHLAALRARPDLSASHHNLGNYLLSKGETAAAAAEFETAIRLEPELLPPYVNLSTAYARLGRNDDAEKSLRAALAIDADNAEANLDLGMLLAEQSRPAEAEAAFRRALRRDPKLSPAAYNLSVLLAADRPEEAIRWARSAYAADASAKNGYNLAFLLRRHGQPDEAAALLRALVAAHPQFLDGLLLLGDLSERQGRKAEAIDAYRAALRIEGLPPPVRRRLEERIRALEADRGK